MPRTFEQSTDVENSPELLRTCASQAMAASPGLEEESVNLLKEYIRMPDKPDESVWEVTAELVDQELSRRRPGTCAGADKLVAEVLKSLPQKAKEALARHFNHLIWDREAAWPEAWKNTLVILLPKKKDWARYKELTLPAVTQHLFLRVLLRLMRPWNSPNEP